MGFLSEQHQDILRPLSNDEILEYLSIYKHLMPCTGSAYFLLLNQWKWNNVKECSREIGVPRRYQTKFYTHRNTVEFAINGTIIGISGVNKIFVFTLEESCHELMNCLCKTKYIDWHNKPKIIALHPKHQAVINKFIDTNRFKIAKFVPSKYLLLNKEDAVDFSQNTAIPPNYELKELDTNDAQIIFENYKSQNDNPIEFIEGLIASNGGFGIYKNNGSELVSWVLKNEYHGIGYLHTVDIERNQGFASILVKQLCEKIFKEDDLDEIAAYVVNSDRESEKCLRKVGFNISGYFLHIELESPNIKST